MTALTLAGVFSLGRLFSGHSYVGPVVTTAIAMHALAWGCRRGTVALADPRLAREAVGVTPRRHPVPVVQASAFRGFRFPPEAILLAVRW